MARLPTLKILFSFNCTEFFFIFLFLFSCQALLRGTTSSHIPSSPSRSSRPLCNAWPHSPGQNTTNMGSLSFGYPPRQVLRPKICRCATKRPIQHCSTAPERRRKRFSTPYLALDVPPLRDCPFTYEYSGEEGKADSGTGTPREFYKQFST